MIVVTGAAGLFGTNFIQYLLKTTDEAIVAIDSLLGGNEEYLSKDPRVTNMLGDLSTKEFQKTLENDVFKKHNTVYIFSSKKLNIILL
jgi:nucleoside-diphosphate-sugar epimerase